MPARLLLIAAVSASTLFSSYDVVSLQLKAPFNALFDRARTDEDFSVVGTLSYSDGGQPVTVDRVQIGVRGHTSRRESECAFPKLKQPATMISSRARELRSGRRCGPFPATTRTSGSNDGCHS